MENDMKMTKKLCLIILATVTGSAQAASLNSEQFIECFETAFNERINELKDKYEGKDIGICDKMPDHTKTELIDLYSETTPNGGRMYYSAESMGMESVRFHYERLAYDMDCYKTPKFIGTLFVKGLGNALGMYEHTPHQLVEDTFTKILGQDMWSENGSDKFNEHNFDYCLNQQEE